jgi:hypothetical protein
MTRLKKSDQPVSCNRGMPLRTRPASEFKIVSGSAHGYGQASAVDADFEWSFRHKRILDRMGLTIFPFRNLREFETPRRRPHFASGRSNVGSESIGLVLFAGVSALKVG